MKKVVLFVGAAALATVLLRAAWRYADPDASRYGRPTG